MSKQNFVVGGVHYIVERREKGVVYSVEVCSVANGALKREALLTTHDKAEACAYYAYLCAKFEEACSEVY